MWPDAGNQIRPYTLEDVAPGYDEGVYIMLRPTSCTTIPGFEPAALLDMIGLACGKGLVTFDLLTCDDNSIRRSCVTRF